VSSKVLPFVVFALGIATSACAQTAIQPINVSGGVSLNKPCPFAQSIYTVPAGKLLIIEDASARAVDASSQSDATNPGIIRNVPIHLALRTNPTGTVSFGSADHTIFAGVGLPAAGGRPMRAYAAPNTNVLFLVGGCQSGILLNTTVHFAGQLIDYP
jgi:hypothetical protein